jgi:hypothetical protein
MPTEREFQISPIVPESVMHNTRVSYIPSYTMTYGAKTGRVITQLARVR